MDRKKIGVLTPGVAQRATYRRSNGKTYCLLNQDWHVEVLIHADGTCIGQGTAEKVDPEEEVDVLCDGVARSPSRPTVSRIQVVPHSRASKPPPPQGRLFFCFYSKSTLVSRRRYLTFVRTSVLYTPKLFHNLARDTQT